MTPTEKAFEKWFQENALKLHDEKCSEDFLAAFEAGWRAAESREVSDEEA